MTIKEAKEEIVNCGCTLRVEDGEYRVNYRYGKEATAYYTNNLNDAVKTARSMEAKMLMKGSQPA
jgi:hypothetical protein